MKLRIQQMFAIYMYWLRQEIHELMFLPLLRRFNPAEPVVEKSVIL